MSEEGVPMDRLAKVYIKIRDRIGELTKDYESQLKHSKRNRTLLPVRSKTSYAL